MSVLLANHSYKSNKQSGFTLIELMVVMVIVAIIIAASVASMNNLTQDIVDDQAGKAKTLLKQASQQAAFTYDLFLVVPNKQGISGYRKTQDQWQEEPSLSLQWHESLEITWQTDETFARQNQLPDSGWLFWPSGETLPGEITAKYKEQQQNPNIANVKWNGVLDFE